jgi:phosphoribosylamine-glycine ligase
MPIVIKYDGLAAGKGVDICETLVDAKKSVDNLLKPNEKIIIEGILKRYRAFCYIRLQPKC